MLAVRPVDRHSPTMMDDIRRFLEQQRLYGVLILPPISENDALAELCLEMGCGYVRMGSAMLDDAVSTLSPLLDAAELHRRLDRYRLDPGLYDPAIFRLISLAAWVRRFAVSL